MLPFGCHLLAAGGVADGTFLDAQAAPPPTRVRVTKSVTATAATIFAGVIRFPGHAICVPVLPCKYSGRHSGPAKLLTACVQTLKLVCPDTARNVLDA